jgi:hypothetical protein
VSVTTSSSIADPASRSIAGPDSTAWVQAAMTRRAPGVPQRTRRGDDRPAVSTMSSTITAVRPLHVADDAHLRDLVRAGTALVDDGEDASRRFANARARSTPPASGLTTAIAPSVTRSRIAGKQDRSRVQVVDGDVEEALDLAGVELEGEHPDAPAVVIRSAMSLALIGTRGATLRSWRA